MILLFISNLFYWTNIFFLDTVNPNPDSDDHSKQSKPSDESGKDPQESTTRKQIYIIVILLISCYFYVVFLNFDLKNYFCLQKVSIF